MLPIDQISNQFKAAVNIITRLRGPNGCPWDREQNHLSLRQYLIEEAYEVLEVLDRYQSKQDPKAIAQATPLNEPVPPDGFFSKTDQALLCEELGDLLIQVLLHSQLAVERGEFHIGDVAEALTKKLIHRHPHVFGDTKVSGSKEVLQNWESLKKKEGKKSLLEGLPKSIPSLQRAARIGEKAHRVGFDWKDWQGTWEKIKEELAELSSAIEKKNLTEIEHEIGDLFFSICQLSRHLSIQPEDAHRKAIHRFEERFKKMEEYFGSQGKEMLSATEEELDQAWEFAKVGC